MNTEEISNLIVEKNKKIIETQETLNIIQEELYKKKKEIADLSESVRKAKFVLSKMKIEKEILEREYWSSK